jgi:hypothetical protein
VFEIVVMRMITVFQTIMIVLMFVMESRN